jgi:hypothetical protein
MDAGGDVVDHGPLSAQLAVRRAKAARSIGWMAVGVGVVFGALGTVAGATGDLLSLALGLASGGLFAGSGLVTARWLRSLERRAVTMLRASERGIEIRLADGRAFAFGWSTPKLLVSAEPSEVFAPALFAVVRLPGVPGLVPGFLADAARWDELQTVARRAEATVRERPTREGHGTTYRIGGGA